MVLIRDNARSLRKRTKPTSEEYDDGASKITLLDRDDDIPTNLKMRFS
jgi:hypothetical protein